MTTDSGQIIFIQELDPDGNFLWAKQMGGSGIDKGLSITTDTSGNIYTMGSFEKTVDFDPGAGVQNFTCAGNKDIFIQKLSQNTTLELSENELDSKFYFCPNPTNNQLEIKSKSKLINFRFMV